MSRLYFEKYKCTFCPKIATRYICASGHERKYIICDEEECNKKAFFKLKYGTNSIKGLTND